MEKDNAEKANTEFDNSVTSEEESSLAENKENINEKQEINDPADVVENEVVTPPENHDKEAEKNVVERPEGKPDKEPVVDAEGEAKLTQQKPDDIELTKELTVDTDDDAKPDSEKVADNDPLKEDDTKAAAPDNSPEPKKIEEPKVIEAENVAAGEEVVAEDAKNEKTANVEEVDNKPEVTKGAKEAPEPSVEEDEWKDENFESFSKEDLVEVIKKLGKYENPFKADRVLQLIAPLFNKMRAADRDQALKKFLQEGGVADDFQYKKDELSLRFDANYKLIKDKKSKKFKEQGHERTKNLAIAEEVLEELRAFVDSEESTASFNQFKIIQQKWKEIGDVPSQNSKTLWANYNALVHRFYDQRSIYFELKELDRRKNYDAKLILCDKAEALENEKNLRDAIKSLNELHYEYKHLGPVPQELQEELWQRFKAASDKVYEKRKEYVTELKASLNQNLLKKEELVEKIKLFTEFQSDRIKDWNEKTKELIQLQKSWDAIGGLPKDKAKRINKEFWTSFKKFFSNKHQFFKKMDADRDANLEKKKELVDMAVALKESEDWQETAKEYKKLQNSWSEIGPVPEKMRNKIYQEFKEACDYFFDRRRAGHKNSVDSYKENLSKKKELIKKINSLKAEADKNLDDFNACRKQFLELGYVPKKNINSIKEEFQSAVEAYLSDVTVLNEKQKTEISLEAEFSTLAGSDHSDRELYQKEQAVRRHINKLEDDIALWVNNLEFFAHSKSTDKLRKDVNAKIEIANSQLEGLKRQLKMLRSL